jgi:hypothetical protein
LHVPGRESLSQKELSAGMTMLRLWVCGLMFFRKAYVSGIVLALPIHPESSRIGSSFEH